MIDMWGGIGSHEKEIDLTPGKSRYFKIWPRKRRVLSSLLGIVGSTVENVVADSKNDGEMELVEFTETEANMYFEQCHLYFEE